MTFTFRPLTPAEAEAAHAIEAASYPADEAASLDQIRKRIQEAGDYFVGAYNDAATLVGFVNGTLTAHRELEEETMSRHDPLGRYLCIHSVVTDPSIRRQGLATKLLKAYVRRVVDEAILLIAKPYLVHFYISCGFTVTRLSPVVHGKDAWMELVLDCTVARQLDVVVVDAFATTPYEGNPAAVVVLSCRQFDAPGVENWMQQVAMERNLSETAFVAPLSEAHVGQNEYRLRWFTPGVEIDLCGHATLATAHVLYEDGHCAKTDPIRFHTRSGVLTTRYTTLEDTTTPAITMDFPESAKTEHDAAWRDATKSVLVSALRVSATDVLALEQYGPSFICQLTPAAFDAVVVDFGLIASLMSHSVIITCKAPVGSGFDFFSRFFAPNCGVNEDPVCGSAHCALVPFWNDHLPQKQRTFVARQKSQRGGTLRLRIENGRVFITGTAVMTLRGKMLE
ncbi:hypothetical protein SPRG_04678 [Saprolegnia parasitica CBS 223.65]|uniref:N-acetyltransferase domain-containing protein n=1 Tax=Saprolegnia parasitica (strain CBS 223.65) TaxID=695850 RepID=A0A067CVG0_SAPPC|nr:hypothetical protein SPRG_04678 [Saprolegnia parasitica CBS 223.65]KDO30777.1 hypothetical protein SPRG_04678 [Saprolegnia parasitica CBS 223.65]|eukprot:XP_012198475.1 hypothetical protein SPRG_04678 [Saprolegnia parasitica CBS 223.65]